MCTSRPASPKSEDQPKQNQKVFFGDSASWFLLLGLDAPRVACKAQNTCADNRQPPITVGGTAGPQPPVPDRGGHRRTSTGKARSQWALPDLNDKIEGQIECQNICQIECQNTCQIECQHICQNLCQIGTGIPKQNSDTICVKGLRPRYHTCSWQTRQPRNKPHQGSKTSGSYGTSKSKVKGSKPISGRFKAFGKITSNAIFKRTRTGSNNQNRLLFEGPSAEDGWTNQNC